MTFLIFIIVLAILVLAHEWGHFIIARRKGLTVEEFGFGFPPRIFGKKIGETTYSINLIPLGGFVKILGEGGEEANNSKSFASKKPGQKSLITVAGPLMNFILAAVLLIVGYNIGLPTIVDETNIAQARNISIQIIAVMPESPARKSGLLLGDEILKFNNTNLREISQLQDYVRKEGGKEVKLIVRRGNDVNEFSVLARQNPPEGQGALGIALGRVGIVSYPWYKSIWLGVKSTFEVTWQIIIGLGRLLKNLIFAGKIPQEISGPVGIAVMTSQAASLGLIYLLRLVAVISLNLTVLNLIPFPALDGGRLFFFGIEKIKGSKISPKIENTLNFAGLALLLILALLITIRDITRLG